MIPCLRPFIFALTLGLGLTAAPRAWPQANVTAEIRAMEMRQTLDGFGAATAFYQNWLTAHPYRQEIYTNMFVGLGLDILRLGNWFRYPATAAFDTDSVQIVTNANRVFGRQVPILMSSWSPPAFLKSNGTTGNGGTLAKTSGVFAYAEFANYWYDAIRAYRSNGISPTWVSIQNEPDWEAGWDTCVFHPAEDTVNGTNYASYALALDAVYRRLTNLPSPPRLVGPETVGIGYNSVQKYAATITPDQLYAVAHHLYHGGSLANPDSFNSSMRGVTNVFPGKPKWQTEYADGDLVQLAWLIHNALTVEEVTAYLYWDLFWDRGGLVALEFPWDSKRWTNAPPAASATQSKGYWLNDQYFSLKHFAYFTDPGYRRVNLTVNDSRVLASAYLSPNASRLTAVLINKDTNITALATLSLTGFGVRTSGVYQTVGATRFAALGPLGPTRQVTLPPYSVTTVVMDAPATNAVPLTLTTLGQRLQLTWPADHTGWTLQVRTNSASTAWNTAWFSVPGAAATNRIDVPMNPSPPGVYYRLSYP